MQIFFINFPYIEFLLDHFNFLWPVFVTFIGFLSRFLISRFGSLQFLKLIFWTIHFLLSSPAHPRPRPIPLSKLFYFFNCQKKVFSYPDILAKHHKVEKFSFPTHELPWFEVTWLKPLAFCFPQFSFIPSRHQMSLRDLS